MKQHDDSGPQRTEINPESDHITFYNPDWRIVPDHVADAVQARFADESRQKFGPRRGKHAKGSQARYLLSGGMLLCPVCGGNFEATNGRYYVCGTRRDGGASACSNMLSLRIDEFDDHVLRLLEGQAFHPAFIEHVLNLACGNRQGDGRVKLEAERDALTEAINRLVALAEAGAGDVAELGAKLRTRTAEREALNRRIAALEEPPNRAKLKAALEHRCADWRARLRSEHPEEARYIVQQLVGPLELCVGSRKQEREKEKALAALGVTADDVRGKENIEWSDCGFAGTLSPLGLLNGLCALNMVAGAGFEFYLVGFSKLVMAHDFWSKQLILNQFQIRATLPRVLVKLLESSPVLEMHWRHQWGDPSTSSLSKGLRSRQ